MRTPSRRAARIAFSGMAHAILPSALALLLAAAAGTATAHEDHAPVAKPVTEAKPAAPAHDMNARWAAQQNQRTPIGISVAMDEHGTLWLARVSEGHLRVSRSTDGGAHFTNETVVNPVPETIRAEGEGRPRIAVRDGVIAVAWPQALAKTFSGHVRFSRSTDGGRTFSAPRTLDDDGNDDTSHGFAALLLGPLGKITVAWLDGRHRATANGRYAGSSLYVAESADGGATFAANRKIADHTCECCRIAIAAGSGGTPVAFTPVASFTPVVLWRQLFDGGVRDFAIARLAPAATPLRASEDDWQIDGCPHHGGDIAIDGKGSAHIAWFTGNPARAGLYWRRIDDIDGIDGPRMTAPRAFGDNDAQAGHPVVHAAGDDIVLAWREFDGEAYRVLAMSSRDRGEHWGDVRHLAHAAGAADLPLFVTGATRPLIAWNTADGVQIIDAGERP